MEKSSRGLFNTTSICILSGVAVCLLVLFCGTPVYLEHRALSTLSEDDPDLRAQFERWYSTRINVSPEGLRVQPFSAETREAVRQFKSLLPDCVETLGAIRDDLPTDPDLITDEMIAMRRKHVETMQPLFEAFSKVIRQPDYTQEVWFGPENSLPRGQILVENPKLLLKVLKALYLKALIALKEGRIDEALNEAETLLVFIHPERFSSLTMRLDLFHITPALYAKNVYRKAFPQLRDSVRKDSIRKLLEKEKAKLAIGPPVEIDLISQEVIGMTSQARYAGQEPDFQNKTGFEVLVESLRVQSDYWEKCVLPALSGAPQQRIFREMVEEEVKQYKQLSDSLRRNRTGLARLFTDQYDRILAAPLFLKYSADEKRVEKRKKALLLECDNLLVELGNTSVENGTTPPV